MAKAKVLGEQYGITITRPWNKAMYAHNDVIAEEMKKNIIKALNNRKYTADQLNDMAASITGYTFSHGMTREDIREELLAEVDRLQNYWLAQEYSRLVRKGYCNPTEKDMIGYTD